MIPLRDSQSSSKFPIQTVFLVIVLCLVFLYELFTPNLDQLIDTLSLTPRDISLLNPTTFYPIASAIFIHAGIIHILSNGWFLWIFGDNIEDVFGYLYIPFFVLGGVIGNLLQYISDPSSDLPILGSSGAVAAILGAYFVFFPKNKIKTLVPILGFVTIINLPASLMLLYWFVTQLFSGASSIISEPTGLGGVAWFAHVGGFACGWVLAQMLKFFRHDRNKYY